MPVIDYYKKKNIVLEADSTQSKDEVYAQRVFLPSAPCLLMRSFMLL